MGSFRTTAGRCVVKHGDIHLEPIGVRGRLARTLKNARQSHEQRYERGILRFVAVLSVGLLSFGQLVYQALTGSWKLVAIGLGFGIVVIVFAWAVMFVRRGLRRWLLGYTDDRVIPLRAVESVDPQPKRPFRSPYIVIHYDEYGEAKKRRVGVCTRTPLAEGEFETAKALLLDDHGLSITPA